MKRINNLLLYFICFVAFALSLGLNDELLSEIIGIVIVIVLFLITLYGIFLSSKYSDPYIKMEFNFKDKKINIFNIELLIAGILALVALFFSSSDYLYVKKIIYILLFTSLASFFRVRITALSEEWCDMKSLDI